MYIGEVQRVEETGGEVWPLLPGLPGLEHAEPQAEGGRGYELTMELHLPAD